MRKSELRAFSLIEILVVVAIIAIMATIGIPAVGTVLRGTQLTRAGNDLVSILSLARQAALTRNHSVEVRFYQYAQSGSEGETVGNPATGKFRAMQYFEIDDSGKATPLDKSEAFPPSIVMDSGATLSSLLAETDASKTTWTALDPKVSLPIVGDKYNCCAFRFAPDGSALLTPKTNLWFLTLYNQKDGDKRAAPPPNYITVQIDPANGALKVWRP